MKKTKRMRALSLLLALLMVTSLFSAANVAAFADSSTNSDTVIVWDSEDLANIKVAGTMYAQWVSGSATSQTYEDITIEAVGEFTCFAMEPEFRWSNVVKFTSTKFIKKIEVTDEKAAKMGMYDDSWTLSGSVFTASISNPDKTVSLRGQFDSISQIKITLTDVALSPAVCSVPENTSVTLEALVADDSSVDATWSVDGSSVELFTNEACTATLSTGVPVSQTKVYARAVEEGTAVVTVSLGSKGSATCALTVTSPVTDIAIDSSSINLPAGNAYKLNASVATEGETDKSVTWTSSDTAVATVDDSGTVYAAAAGTTTITATSNADKSKSVECTVTASAHTPQSGGIKAGEIYLNGDTLTNSGSETIYFRGDNGNSSTLQLPANNSVTLTGYGYRGNWGGWNAKLNKDLYESDNSHTSSFINVTGSDAGYYGIYLSSGTGTHDDPFVFKMADPPHAPVSYMAWDEDSKTVKEIEGGRTNYFKIDNTNNAQLDVEDAAIGSSAQGGNFAWIVIDGDVTFSNRISVLGTANLILCDGANLTAQNGITVADGSTLNIYPGSTGESVQGTGQLRANDGYHDGAGIGGVSGDGGNVTIHGGDVYACGGNGGAGIGGDYRSTVGTVTIYGGDVTAIGNRASGIGGGMVGNGGTVAIYGGTVSTNGIGSMGIGYGMDGSENGSLTLGKGMNLYGGTSAEPEKNPANHLAYEGEYTGTRYQYMTINNVEPYTHTYVYTLDGDTLTVTCSDENCPVPGFTGALTLKAQDKEYDGTPVTATLEKSGKWKNPEGASPSEITYTPANSSKPGTYTASVTVGNYTLTKQFTISGSQWKIFAANLEKNDTVKLDEDITAGSEDTTITLKRNVTLDLNGHTIDANGGDFDIFKVNGGKFTLTDSSEAKTGTITGSNASGVTVAGGAFVMNGGTISGNACGVNFQNGSVTLSGSPVINDNFSEESDGGLTYPIAKNLYAAEGKIITIGQLDDDALIGVSAENDKEASGQTGILVGSGVDLEGCEDCFFADRSSVNDDVISLVVLSGSSKNDALYIGGTSFQTYFPVSFYSAGSLYGEVQTVTLGETANKPADPTLEGYTFVRWERYGHDDDGNTYEGKEYDFNTPVTEPVVLEAIWKQNQYTVTFINGSTSTKQTVGYGQKVSKPATPSAPSTTQNTFAGWVMAETVSTKNISGQAVRLSKDSAYDFNSPVYTDIKLKSTWSHVHDYKLYTLNEMFGADHPTAIKANSLCHVKKCDCWDYEVQYHEFVNGKCACGYTKPIPPEKKVSIHLTYCVEGGTQVSMEMEETVTKDNEVFYSAPNFYKKTNIFDHWECAFHDKNDWETVSYKQTISFQVHNDIDLRAVYKPYSAEPNITLRTGRTNGKDYSLTFMDWWWVPPNWQVISAGMKIGDNDRLRYWSNASMGRIAVNDYPLMNYEKKIAGVSLGNWGGGYRPVALMRNMMSGTGFSANRDGIAYAANVDSRIVPNALRDGNQVEELNVGKKHKGDWQYVFAFVEVRDPLNNHFIYYTDPIQMRYEEWDECNQLVGTQFDENGKETKPCSKDMYVN